RSRLTARGGWREAARWRWVRRASGGACSGALGEPGGADATLAVEHPLHLRDGLLLDLAAHERDAGLDRALVGEHGLTRLARCERRGAGRARGLADDVELHGAAAAAVGLGGAPALDQRQLEGGADEALRRRRQVAGGQRPARR